MPGSDSGTNLSRRIRSSIMEFLHLIILLFFYRVFFIQWFLVWNQGEGKLWKVLIEDHRRRKKKSRRLVHLVQPKVECWLQGEPDVQSNRLAALLSSSFTFGSPTLTKSSPTHNQSYSTEGWGWWKLVTNRRWSMKTSATIQSKIEDQPLLMITNQRLGIMVGLVAES